MKVFQVMVGFGAQSELIRVLARDDTDAIQAALMLCAKYAPISAYVYHLIGSGHAQS